MKFGRLKLAALGAAVLLASCGGGSGGIDVNSTVTFGDSLSDVGTYRVGTVAALGGGKFTVNPGVTWTETVAAAVHTPAPCAAQTGLLPNLPGVTGAAVTNHPECTNYAQGSARVSGVYSINSATLQAAPINAVNLGLLAVPINTQMSVHLAKIGGTYSGRELVTVQGGGNDLFMHFGGIAAAGAGGAGAVGAAFAAGWSTEVQNAVALGGAAATSAAVNAAAAGMGAAGAELAGLVKTQILAKGARYVVVTNLPDVAQTPFGLSLDAQSRGLITNLVTAFNSQLQSGLNGSAALYVDDFTQRHVEYANPSKYGITNLTTTACSTTSPANPLQGASLGCTAASTVAADTSGYQFADQVHPTPLGHQLIANYVIAQMRSVGWI